MRAGIVRALLDQTPAKARLQAACERDDALRVALEQLHVDVGLAAPEALEEARRGQLDQIAEAVVVRGEEREVVALDPALGAAVVDQVGLEPQDRLDVVLETGLVVLDRAVHDAVIGQPERRLPELRGTRRHRLDLVRAVQQRVLAVDVQMDRGVRQPRPPTRK